MTLIFHERVGLDGRRISPFSWRIRYAFAHKQLRPEIVATRFADVDRIRALSGQHFVPIIEDGGVVVHDSWSIASYLEDRHPDRPSLFGGPVGRATSRVINVWSDTVLAVSLRPVIYADFMAVIDPADRAYFRRSREQVLGTTLERFSADPVEARHGFAQACLPLEKTLSDQPFLAGTTPAYADYTVFSVFQWARVGGSGDVLDGGDLHAIRAWRARMIDLYGGLGDGFPLYPSNPAGPNGRAPQQEST